MVELKYKYNDGGRSKYYNTTNGDCVIRAIAIVLNRDYMEVYNQLKHFRRRPSYGIPTEFGFEYIAFDYPKFLCKKSIPMDERIIVYSNNHFSAIINGEVNDVFKSHCVYDCNLINGYYKLKNK